MKVLIVDDEKLIRDVIKEYCSFEGYDTVEAEDGYVALEKVRNEDIDIIILDIMMPRLDGFSAYEKIKEIKDISTIILSARNEEYDKLSGFNIGVDDYMTKPFSPKELMARIKAVTKRNKNHLKQFSYEELHIDFDSHVLKIKDKEINLTPKELLKVFLNSHNVVLTREYLLTEIWGYDFYGDDRTVDTHIKTLRKKLESYGNLIKTVRGVGYKIEMEE